MKSIYVANAKCAFSNIEFGLNCYGPFILSFYSILKLSANEQFRFMIRLNYYEFYLYANNDLAIFDFAQQTNKSKHSDSVSINYIIYFSQVI